MRRIESELYGDFEDSDAEPVVEPSHSELVYLSRLEILIPTIRSSTAFRRLYNLMVENGNAVAAGIIEIWGICHLLMAAVMKTLLKDTVSRFWARYAAFKGRLIFK